MRHFLATGVSIILFICLIFASSSGMRLDTLAYVALLFSSVCLIFVASAASHFLNSAFSYK